MFRKKVIVVGGSIAGSAIAILLQRLGAEVIILERSAGQIAHGAGITLPESFVNQCISLDLFDPYIPRLTVSGRSFSRKHWGSQTTFWQQPLSVVTLNWMHVYQNLRARINPAHYHPLTEVRYIKKIGNHYHLETSTGITYQADFVIAADGIDSMIRTQLIPEASPTYADYIAWRGLVEIPGTFNQHVPYYVFPEGHILLYQIPAPDYANTGHTLLNWVLYENRPHQSIGDLLIDKQGNLHTRSLPQGHLTESHLHHLHELTQRVLPASIAQLIRRTSAPFLQAIFDFQQPTIHDAHAVAFIGDAASTLRPHTASGVFKALSNAMELSKLIQMSLDADLIQIIAQWESIQKRTADEEVPKAMVMGEALVTNPPNWSQMDQASTDQWWAALMQGKTWYATNSPKKEVSWFFGEKKLDPEKSKTSMNLSSKL